MTFILVLMLGAGAVLVISSLEPGPDGGGVSIRDTIVSIWQGQLPIGPADHTPQQTPAQITRKFQQTVNAGSSGVSDGDEAVIHTLNARLRAGGQPPQDPRTLRWMRLHGYYTA